jgi:succinate dehydrogenase / fumarate reductase cytochrome b subunit
MLELINSHIEKGRKFAKSVANFWLIGSPVGRKFVMALTGLGLLGFVLMHGAMNFVYLIDPKAYDWICRELLGANWWAIIATMGLRLLFLLHIVLAFYLTWQNRKARGTDRYNVTKRQKGVTWQSMNMLFIGIVLMVFLAFHIYHFLIRMQITEIMYYFFGVQDFLGFSYEKAAVGSYHVSHWFSIWWVSVIYLIGIVALWLHVTHGFWSGMQSIGLSNNKWLPRIKVISFIIATLACALFAIIPLLYLFGIPDLLNNPNIFRITG